MGFSLGKVMGIGLLAAAWTGCTEDKLPLEHQAGRFREAKLACDDPAPASYRVADAFEDNLEVGVFDCGYALPSRITISEDGRWMFVAQLQGRVYLYRKHGTRFELQDEPFYDLGDLGVSDEAGLTGLALAPDFDAAADNAERREVFLAYQAHVDGQPRNRVRRVTATLHGETLIGRDALDIFTPDESSGQAHQIQQPVAFEYRGQTHLLVPVGDGANASRSRDPATTNGTLVMLQRNGEPPEDARPWPEHPYVQAIGLRNVYGVELVPEHIDPRRGLLGMENGDYGSDRGWYAHVLPDGSSSPTLRDLGATGNDDALSWRYAGEPDAADASGRKRNIVFQLFTPTISPTAISLHPGSSLSDVIPAPGPDSGTFVGAFFGKSDTKDLGPGKNVQLLLLDNLGAGQLRAELVPIVERTLETFGTFRHPVGLDVDPENGDIYFSDIITGEIYRITEVE